MDDNKNLSDPAIARSIHVLVGSEVGGVQAAAFAERYARNAAERTTYAALHALELQTRDAGYQHLGDTAARFAATGRFAAAIGIANAAAGTVLPHRMQMRSLMLATKPFCGPSINLTSTSPTAPMLRSFTMSSPTSLRSPNLQAGCSHTTMTR